MGNEGVDPPGGSNDILAFGQYDMSDQVRHDIFDDVEYDMFVCDERYQMVNKFIDRSGKD